MDWLGNPIAPRNGRIGRSATTRLFLMGELINGSNNMGLNRLIYKLDKNHLGCQHGRCLCGGLREFQRGVMVLRVMANQMAIRKSKMEIAEFRSRVGEKVFMRSACTDYVARLRGATDAKLHPIAVNAYARTTSLFLRDFAHNVRKSEIRMARNLVGRYE